MGVEDRRCGTVLILVVMVLFALLGVSGLLIDLAMARLTQAHMQSVADAAAIEGGWELAAGGGAIDVRQAILDRADEVTESWGTRRIEFQPGGFNLDGDGVPESSLTINRETLGDAVKPELNANVDNAPQGDIVFGKYDGGSVPFRLPGQPTGYDRGEAFVSSSIDDGNAILVRLRRTGETEITGGTSAEPLAYLWSRGSLLDFGLRGRGISVRGESIVELVPAVAVGTAMSPQLPTAIGAAVELNDVRELRFSGITLLRPENPFEVGSPMIQAEPEDGIGYLPIADLVTVDGSSENRVVGFMLARVDAEIVTPMTLFEMGFERGNVTANLGWINLRPNSDLLRINQSLQNVQGNLIARAPRLVRSRQIQSGDTP